MDKKTLRQLYAEHQGKSSDKWSLYLREYDRLLGDYRDKPVRLLEIGIQNGGSLEVWSKFFGQPSVLVGCDINPDCARLEYDHPSTHVVIGDANSTAANSQILGHSPQFDIVIDDGSHRSGDIVKSFALYFPRIIEGGVFIAEDLHCSYWQQFEGGLFDPTSSISFFKRLADIANHEHWYITKSRRDLLQVFNDKYGVQLSEEILGQVHSVEFINSMCVVRKAAAADNGLGHRVIAGSEERVVQGHQKLQGAPYEADPNLDQSRNLLSNITKPVEEELADTKIELARAYEETKKLAAQIVDLKNEIGGVYRSRSWRLTKPLRHWGLKWRGVKGG